MSRQMITGTEVEIRYDRPLWAATLRCCEFLAGNDHTPYYWVDETETIIKRVTSKRKLSCGVYISDLSTRCHYMPAKFKLPFFDEARAATMLEF